MLTRAVLSIHFRYLPYHPINHISSLRLFLIAILAMKKEYKKEIPGILKSREIEMNQWDKMCRSGECIWKDRKLKIITKTNLKKLTVIEIINLFKISAVNL